MPGWQPLCLPEDPVPCDAFDCRDCGLYLHGTRMVWGEGMPFAPVFVVLDNPGAREDRSGEPFVCGTRETLQKAAVQADISLDDLYISYILKRRPRRAYDKPRTRAICIKHLERQLRVMKPQLVFCLGNVAVQSFLGDPEADVKSLRGQWLSARGLPSAVSYHPLAVRRRPNLYPLFLDDWRMLRSRI